MRFDGLLWALALGGLGLLPIAIQPLALAPVPAIDLTILNTPNAAGEIVVVSGEFVEVQFVTADTEGVLEPADTIELVDADTGETVSKKKRGSLTSGTISVKAKNLTHGYVRYVNNGVELARVPALGQDPILVVSDPAYVELLDRVIALEMAGSASLPIGTIVGWHEAMAGTPPLAQDGEWARCDGQVLSDPGSPYNGMTVPNLNGNYVAGLPGGLFLRGGQVSGMVQGDALQQHDHKQGRGRGVAGQGPYHAWQTQGAAFGWEPFMYQLATYDAAGNLLNPLTALPTEELTITNEDLSWGRTAFASKGNLETRPANMSVVWLMRVK